MMVFLPTGRKGACQEIGMGYLRGASMLTRFVADGSWLVVYLLSVLLEAHTPY